MTENERKRALAEIEKLEENNQKIGEEIKQLESIHDKDEETLKKIDTLKENVIANNISLNQLKDLLKQDVEKLIEKFNADSVRIEDHLKQIKATFVLTSSVEEVNIGDALTGLTEELKEFEIEANKLVEDMTAFKEMTGKDDFNLTPKEIKIKVKEFKSRLRDLKKEQIIKYNDRVERINELIKKYKETIKSDSEAYVIVNGLEYLSLCSATVSEWRHISYLSEIDYNKMLETVKKIKEIETKDKPQNSYDSVEADLNYIADRILALEMKLDENLDYDAVVKIHMALNQISDLLIEFGNKLDSLKDKIAPEDYEKYNNRYKGLMLSYLSLQKKLRDVEKNVNKEEKMDYETISKKIEGLDLEVTTFDFGVDSLYGKVLLTGSDLFSDKYKKLLQTSKDIEKIIEESYKDKLIDDNQYKNLNDQLNAVVDKLNKVDLKLKDPKMFSVNEATDIYAFLNGTIEGLDKALDALERQLEGLEKPIKDKNVRKNIDAIFKKVELEIKNLEKQLKMYKNNDPQKYEETKKKLENTKKRMYQLGKQYRRKCPFLVRAVKSAKHFFKKYKKVLLIIAGLAAFAILAHSVIIPAIMHGNIMICAFSPALRGPIKAITNLLGGLIGATKDTMGFWTLANGVRLNSYAATSSLLKGLAISGIGSATLIAPLVIAVKKLIEKINMAELKQKLVNGKNAVVDKISGVKEKITTKKAGNKAKKGIKSSIDELIKDFIDSGLSADTYCANNNLNSFQTELVHMYETEAIEKREQMKNRKGSK